MRCNATRPRNERTTRGCAGLDGQFGQRLCHCLELPCTPQMARDPKPPYTSTKDIDAFFDKVGGIQKPNRAVDREWVEAYGFDTAHPTAIPSLLRWLGVLDDDGNPKDAWNKLRVSNTRQETLGSLVRESYKKLFDTVDVEQVSRETLEGGFIEAYEVGDVQRHVGCFLRLCEHAGISVAAQPARREKEPRAPKPKAERPRRERAAGDGSKRRNGRPESDESPSVGLSIALTVDIPADWSSEQIKERLAVVSRAVREAGFGGT